MPASDPITAIANTVGLAIGLTGSLLDDNRTHRYDDVFRKDLSRITTTLAERDPDLRADLLSVTVRELCLDAGTPSGELGDLIAVPEQALQALLVIAAEHKRDVGYLAEITAAMTRKS